MSKSTDSINYLYMRLENKNPLNINFSKINVLTNFFFNNFDFDLSIQEKEKLNNKIFGEIKKTFYEIYVKNMIRRMNSKKNSLLDKERKSNKIIPFPENSKVKDLMNIKKCMPKYKNVEKLLNIDSNEVSYNEEALIIGSFNIMGFFYNFLQEKNKKRSLINNLGIFFKENIEFIKNTFKQFYMQISDLNLYQFLNAYKCNYIRDNLKKIKEYITFQNKKIKLSDDFIKKQFSENFDSLLLLEKNSFYIIKDKNIIKDILEDYFISCSNEEHLFSIKSKSNLSINKKDIFMKINFNIVNDEIFFRNKIFLKETIKKIEEKTKKSIVF